jgi:hypothetical protein
MSEYVKIIITYEDGERRERIDDYGNAMESAMVLREMGATVEFEEVD